MKGILNYLYNGDLRSHNEIKECVDILISSRLYYEIMSRMNRENMIVVKRIKGFEKKGLKKYNGNEKYVKITEKGKKWLDSIIDN